MQKFRYIGTPDMTGWEPLLKKVFELNTKDIDRVITTFRSIDFFFVSPLY